MTPLSIRTVITVFVALAVPATLSLWLLSAPELMSVSTYAALTALLIGIASVTLNSARNAGPTGSLGQLIYETEQQPQTGARRATPRRNSW